jgi:hypothetical protein
MERVQRGPVLGVRDLSALPNDPAHRTPRGFLGLPALHALRVTAPIPPSAMRRVRYNGGVREEGCHEGGQSPRGVWCWPAHEAAPSGPVPHP